MNVKSYRDLEVWQEAMNLVEIIYKILKLYPKDETFGLTKQIQRAAVSIPSNIAEGWGKMGKNELRRYLLISRGSAMELETQLILSVKLGFITKERIEPVWKQLQSVLKLIGGLIRSINKKINDGKNEIEKGNRYEER
jgi:four helix bundle protein